MEEPLTDIPIEPTRQPEPALCKVCGIPLISKTEAKIGVHVRCVFIRQQSKVTIPRPRYR